MSALSSFHDIETICGVAVKATLLINSARMAFYLLAFDVRHLCKGYGRMQSRALSLQGPPPGLPASSPGRPSFRKYWLLDSERLCVRVCIRRVASERNCKHLCVSLCVCCACLSPCTNGEIGGESHPEAKGHLSCKREKGNSIFLDALLPNAPTRPSPCCPWLLVACTYIYMSSSPASKELHLICCIQGFLLPTTPAFLLLWSCLDHEYIRLLFYVNTATQSFWTWSDCGGRHRLFSMKKLEWNAWVFLFVKFAKRSGRVARERPTSSKWHFVVPYLSSYTEKLLCIFFFMQYKTVVRTQFHNRVKLLWLLALHFFLVVTYSIPIAHMYARADCLYLKKKCARKSACILRVWVVNKFNVPMSLFLISDTISDTSKYLKILELTYLSQRHLPPYQATVMWWMSRVNL